MSFRTELSDEQLVTYLKAGDEVIFHQIYDRYYKRVYLTALKILRNKPDAEDVMQEVLLKLWISSSNLHSDSNLNAYIIKLTKNACYNLLRRQVLAAKAMIDKGLNWQEFQNDTEEQVVLQETQRILQDAINLLPPQQREVYELCQIRGMTYDQAAENMNLSPNTIHGYMKLALKSIRGRLKSQHIFSIILLIISSIIRRMIF